MAKTRVVPLAITLLALPLAVSTAFAQSASSSSSATTNTSGSASPGTSYNATPGSASSTGASNAPTTGAGISGSSATGTGDSSMGGSSMNIINSSPAASNAASPSVSTSSTSNASGNMGSTTGAGTSGMPAEASRGGSSNNLGNSGAGQSSTTSPATGGASTRSTVVAPAPASTARNPGQPRPLIGGVEFEHLEPTRREDSVRTNAINMLLGAPFWTSGRLSLLGGLTVHQNYGTVGRGNQNLKADAWGVGPMAVLRWATQPAGAWMFGFDVSAAALVYENDFPQGAEQYNFMLRAGPTIGYHINNRTALTFGATYSHTTNGRDDSSNQNFDQAGLRVGFQHRF